MEEDKMYKNATKAVIKENAKELDQLFQKVSKKLEDKLNYNSTKYVVFGVLNSFSDSVYTIFEGIKKLADTDITSIIDSYIPNNYNAKVENMMSKYKIAKNQLELKEAIDKKDTIIKYTQNLADYCSETGISPTEVLDSPKDHINVIKKTYGSLDKYREKIISASKLKEIDQAKVLLSIMPLDTVVEAYLSAGIGTELESIGIDPKDIAGVVKRYADDLILVVDTLMEENKKLSLKKLSKYEKLDK